MSEPPIAPVDDFGSLIRSDAACHGGWAAAVISLGFHAAFAYRVSSWCHRHGADPLGRAVQGLATLFTGADISRKARIGGSLGIFHPHAILIGPGVEMGHGCNLYQGCAITPDTWVPNGNSSYPVVEERVYVGAGAKILGGVRVGHDARIAPNSVVLKDVPAGATALGVPARMIAAEFRHE